MQLTREQTARYEFGRYMDNWRVLSKAAPENSPCAGVYTDTDEEFQEIALLVEETIETEEVLGTDENNETYTLVPIPDRKPPGRPPGTL